jgi:hypothetical protein
VLDARKHPVNLHLIGRKSGAGEKEGHKHEEFGMVFHDDYPKVTTDSSQPGLDQ